jgi:hypothetical protein
MATLDPWEVLQGALSDLKIELRNLGDKYTDNLQKVWIKLTELELRLNNEIVRDNEKKSNLRWLIPTIISLLSVVAVVLSLYKGK